MNQAIEGVVDCFVNGCLAGWARVPGSPDRLEIRVRLNGVEVACTRADMPRPDLAAGGLGDGNHGFLVAVDPACFDSATQASVTVLAMLGEEGVALHPGLMIAQADDGFGFLEALTEESVYGWVAPRMPNAPDVCVELLIDGAPRARAIPTGVRGDLSHFRLHERPTGFSFPLSIDLFDGAAHRVEVRVAATGTLLFGGPHIFEARAPVYTPLQSSGATTPVPSQAVFRVLDGIAEHLLARTPQTLATGAQADVADTWIRTVLVPELLRASRAHQGGNFEVALRLPLRADVTMPEADDGVTDVVIPVYRGFEETLACINSVIESAGHCPQEIVVVDDCTPDPMLAAALERLAAEGRITRLVHPENRGFVASANAGMALHPHRDVVLLNSDTVVPGGWLDRMRHAAYAGPTIGTVTPFSNRATICSFPAMPDDNDLPAGWTLQELDDAFARHNAGLLVDIPTAVGFCMYIRRAVIRDTGFFDEATWGRGYGEENDYCLRSAARGWRHVQACDIFVQHHGSVSFSAEKTALIAAHLDILNGMYPDYAWRVAQHLKADPVAPARHRVLKEVYQREASTRMLFITHALGGDTQVAIECLIDRLHTEDVAVLVLVPLAEDHWRLARPGDGYGLDYRMPGDFSQFLEDLRDLGVWHAHCHHLAGFGPFLLSLLEDMPFTYDVSVHDYLWICPRVTLLDGDSRYCGEPTAAACDRCIAQAGVFPALMPLFASLARGTERWRSIMARVLHRARRVMVPSEDVAARLRRHMVLENLVLRPHPEAVACIDVPARAPGLALNVAVIGAIGDHNGLAMLRACAAEATVRSMDVQFKVIGYTADDASLRQYRNVLVTGPYARDRLDQIAQVHHCKLALFLSPGPKTFSYTLSEALRAGLYPVVPALGAPADRVRQAGFGEVYAPESTPLEILERLLAVAARGVPPARLSLGCEYGSLLGDYYGLVRVPVGQADPATGVVCVLGMHRSGTSALAGALEAAGLRTGEVLRFGSDNVKGHIESRLVIGINDAVLQRSGGSWHEAPHTLIWTDAERRRRDTFIAAREAGGTPWLFKDPRTLLTFPFWQEALPKLTLVGTFRHPLNVAFSLFQRNGLALAEGLRVWTAYNRRLLTLWEETRFPLLCFNLPEGAYRASLTEMVYALGARIGNGLNAELAVDFYSADLRACAIPKAFRQEVPGTVEDDLAGALDLYERLLACAGVDYRLQVHTDLCLPLAPTIEMCRRLLAEMPENAMVLTILATLLEQAEAHEAACEAHRDLVMLTPGNYLAVRALLDSLVAAGLHKEALAWATRALDSHPHNPDLHFWLGAANVRHGDRAAAVAHFRAARDADYGYLSCTGELAALEGAA